MDQAKNQSLQDYAISARRTSKIVTQTFSSSFSSAISLFGATIRQDIYNIYGLVRVADEIVDTYTGQDAEILLNDFEQEVYAALKRNFSANIIIHAFIETAKKYTISKDLIEPFFVSMRMDLKPALSTQKSYDTYIYGSAEVVGLMCLRVFVQGNVTQYHKLTDGAKALGAAFQKVNFLRDMYDDYTIRGRYYFPYGTFESFNDELKNQIIADINQDFTKAKMYIAQLPRSARSATRLAYRYYLALLDELSKQPASKITIGRISISKNKKLSLLMKAKVLPNGS